MNEFDIFEKEMEIEYMECEMIANSNPLIYMESKGSGKNKAAKANQSILKKLIDKIKSMIEKIKAKISEILTSKKMKDTEEQIKNIPNGMKTKVQSIDHEKLLKLDEKTMKELTTAKDSKAVIEKYKKERNIILATFVPVTIGGLFMFAKKNSYKKMLDQADHYLDKKIVQCNSLYDQIDKLKDERIKANIEKHELSKQVAVLTGDKNKLSNENNELKKKNKMLSDNLGDAEYTGNLSQKSLIQLTEQTQNMGWLVNQISSNSLFSPKEALSAAVSIIRKSSKGIDSDTGTILMDKDFKHTAALKKDHNVIKVSIRN